MGVTINKKSTTIRISCLSRANVRAFHENPDHIYTQLIFINPLNAYYEKKCMLMSSVEIFEDLLTNRVEPEQNAPVGAV